MNFIWQHFCANIRLAYVRLVESKNVCSLSGVFILLSVSPNQALSVFLPCVICIKKSVIIGWGFFLFPLEAERYWTDSWSFWSPVCSSGLPPLQTSPWSKHYERTYHFKRRPFSAPFRPTCQSLWQRCNHQIHALLPCLPSQVTKGIRVWWRLSFCWLNYFFSVTFTL